MNSYRQSQYDSREFIISMTDRNYGELQLCDAVLKVWLPEYVMQMLYEITVLHDFTIADFIRQTLFVHLYGKYDFLGFIERSNLTFIDPDKLSPCAKTAPLNEATPVSPLSIEHDSNKVIALKIPLPSAMKRGLQNLADAKYQPISEYTRRLIITHLIGHQESFPVPPKGVLED